MKPATRTLPERATTLLIGALGGEGGGLLADWVVGAARAAGFPVQSTSIPGVAQRTGATTYYVEVYPVALAALGGREPVMSLYPARATWTWWCPRSCWRPGAQSRTAS